MSYNEKFESLLKLTKTESIILFEGKREFLGDFIKEFMPYSLIMIFGNKADFFKSKEYNDTNTVFLNKELVSNNPNGLKSIVKSPLGDLGVELIIIDVDNNKRETIDNLSILVSSGFKSIIINNEIDITFNYPIKRFKAS